MTHVQHPYIKGSFGRVRDPRKRYRIEDGRIFRDGLSATGYTEEESIEVASITSHGAAKTGLVANSFGHGDVKVLTGNREYIFDQVPDIAAFRAAIETQRGVAAAGATTPGPRAAGQHGFEEVAVLAAQLPSTGDPSSGLKLVDSISWSDTKEFIATNSTDGEARIWNAFTGELLSELGASLRFTFFEPGDGLLAIRDADQLIGWKIRDSLRNRTGKEWLEEGAAPLSELHQLDNPRVEKLIQSPHRSERRHIAYFLTGVGSALGADASKSGVRVFGQTDFPKDAYNGIEVVDLKFVCSWGLAAIHTGGFRVVCRSRSFGFECIDGLSSHVLDVTSAAAPMSSSGVIKRYDDFGVLGNIAFFSVGTDGVRCYSEDGPGGIVPGAEEWLPTTPEIIAGWPNEFYLAVAGGRHIAVLDLRSDIPAVKCRFEHEDQITQIEWSSFGNEYLTSASRDGTVRLWNVDEGRQVVCFDGMHPVVQAFRWTEDMTYLGCSDASGDTHVFRNIQMCKWLSE